MTLYKVGSVISVKGESFGYCPLFYVVSDAMPLTEPDRLGCAFIKEILMFLIGGYLFAIVHSPEDDPINKANGLQ